MSGPEVGCCDSCSGTGAGREGACWDCRGTGCAHERPCQEPETDGRDTREDDRPYIVNPESVGDPDQTPIVQLPPAWVAIFERTRCPECDLINYFHEDDCSRRTP